MVSAARRQAFIQPNRPSAAQTLRHVADRLRPKWPRLAGFIVDSLGKIAREVSVASTPEAVSEALKKFGQPLKWIGLEAGPSSAWIARG